MKDGWCFCTLALGVPYCKLARQLASDLVRFAPGVPFVVVTDDPRSFKGVNNVRAISHRKKSVLGYNDKLCVIKKALDQYSTAIFIDADARILGPIDLNPDILKPGLWAFLIREWAYMQDTYDTSVQGPEWQKKDLRMLTLLRDEFNLASNGRDVPCVVESLFAVTRGNEPDTAAFMQKWNDLAEFCEQRGFFVHEGYSMGLAARLTSFPIEQHGFEGFKFFEPVVSRAIDVANGLMTQEEYDVLNAAISRYKDRNSRASIVWAAIEALKKHARYCRIKLFGLNLIDC